MIFEKSATLTILLFLMLASYKCKSQVPEGRELEGLDLLDFSYAGHDFGESELPVNPVIVGFQGEGTSFKNAGVIQSFGQAVEPSSLYLYQLKKRLDKVPKHLQAD